MGAPSVTGAAGAASAASAPHPAVSFLNKMEFVIEGALKNRAFKKNPALRRVLTVFFYSSLEASCQTKLVAPPDSIVHARAVACLKALKVFFELLRKLDISNCFRIYLYLGTMM